MREILNAAEKYRGRQDASFHVPCTGSPKTMSIGYLSGLRSKAGHVPMDSEAATSVTARKILQPPGVGCSETAWGLDVLFCQENL